MMTINLKESLNHLTELGSVEGALVVDSEGLIMESNFPSTVDTELLGSIYAIIDLNVKGQLNSLSLQPNQIFFSTDQTLIIIQKIEDVMLIIYSKKENLAELQSRLEQSASQVHDFLNISRNNS